VFSGVPRRLIWDLAPGHHVLRAAGGATLDLDGHPLRLDYGFDSLSDIVKAIGQRQTFVAVSGPDLAKEIINALAAH
jgi:myo-inositol-1(or 4)-monophosphatase